MCGFLQRATSRGTLKDVSRALFEVLKIFFVEVCIDLDPPTFSGKNLKTFVLLFDVYLGDVGKEVTASCSY